MNPRIPSLTERALFYPTALQLFFSSNCQERVLSTRKESLLETVAASPFNIYASPLKTSVLHWGMKPARALGRVVYTAAVITTFAPLGILYNGFQGARHYAVYKIASHKNDTVKQESAKEKSIAYAKAFFTDLTCTILGGLAVTFSGLILYGVTEIIFNPWETLSYKIQCLFGATCIIGVISHAFGAFEPERMFPKLIAYSDERAGMYLALALRNRLGLVSSDKGLLAFSSMDQLEYTHTPNGYAFSLSQNYMFLFDLISNAELELLTLVRTANAYTKNNGGEEIPFTYPFKGSDIASLIETRHLSKGQKKTSSNQSFSLGEYQADLAAVQNLANRLRMLDRKIDLLRTMFDDARKLTLESSTWATFLYMLGRREPPSISLNNSKANVPEDAYREYFNAPFVKENIHSDNIGYAAAIPYIEILNKCPLPALDPAETTKPQAKNLYESFKYRIQTAKWSLAHNGKIMTPWELLGLAEGYVFKDLKTATRKYSMAIHPDKNMDKRDEATQLFQTLSQIVDLLGSEENR